MSAAKVTRVHERDCRGHPLQGRCADGRGRGVAYLALLGSVTASFKFKVQHQSKSLEAKAHGPLTPQAILKCCNRIRVWIHAFGLQEHHKPTAKVCSGLGVPEFCPRLT